jgi:hypothetical protein
VPRLSRRGFLAATLATRLPGQQPFALSSDDQALLEDMSRRIFRYFWEQADPNTGLVLDRARSDGTSPNPRVLNVASTASTGFGLTALCIAHQRRWMNQGQLKERVRSTLRHLANDQPHHLGWFYHFLDSRTGERVWNCEISSIDTAILIAGTLTARQCFRDDAEIVRLATTIYERIDFTWMLDARTQILRMGWRPETGFVRGVWGNYRENPILNILSISSPTHPVPLGTWYRFTRDPIILSSYGFVGRGPLFTHQFPQAWLSLAGLRDGLPFGIDYFQNSIVATRAHRAYCLSLRSFYPGFSNHLWGVTPSDSDIGYIGWGSVMIKRRDFDGTVVPCAAGGSLMFAPDICLPVLETFHNDFGEYAYTRYGFTDALNPLTLWIDPDVVGIDLGITLLSAENLRTGNVWKWFMANPEIGRTCNRIFERDASAA